LIFFETERCHGIIYFNLSKLNAIHLKNIAVGRQNRAFQRQLFRLPRNKQIMTANPKASNPKKDSWRENFDDLVSQLAFNYFACSFGDSRNDIEFGHLYNVKPGSDFEKEYTDQKKTANPKDKVYRTRNILVVGAGASMDSFTGLPGGDLLIRRMMNEQKANFPDGSTVANRLQMDTKEILSITGKDKLYFENYLYIMSRSFMTQNEIRKKIKTMTNARYATTFFNEIVAHMLKHSFLDAVINFNFEETLDQAILEEIGAGNYHNIISDGHCIDLDSITSKGTLKVPIYIKPHGTNSHKSSLRFTNKHYFDIPEDIATMLKCLVGGFKNGDEIETMLRQNDRKKVGHINFSDPAPLRQTILENDKNRTIHRVNLIAVGFNMESIEFLDILNNYLPTDSKIYYINYMEPPPQLMQDVYRTKLADFFLSSHYRHLKKRLPVAKGEGDRPVIEAAIESKLKFIECRDAGYEIAGAVAKPVSTALHEYEKSLLPDEPAPMQTYDTSLPPLGRLFSYLYTEIWDNYEKPYRPQHIFRHQLTSLLFYNPLLRAPCPNVDYKHAGKAFHESEDLENRLKHYKVQQTMLEKEFEPSYFENETEHINFEYFLDRTIVEIAIVFLRGHGIIDYFELKHGRVNQYYKFYITQLSKYNAQQSEADKISPKSLAELTLKFVNPASKSFAVDNNIIKLDLCRRPKTTSDPDAQLLRKFAVLDDVEAAKALYNNLQAKLAELIGDENKFQRKFGTKTANRNKRNICAHTLAKLLSHDDLSSRFIKRFAANQCLKGIQKMKHETPDTETKNSSYKYEVLDFLEMVIYAANALVANNFYSISTQYMNTEFFTWQSFSLRSQLHTNLQLDYELIRALREQGSNENRHKFVLSVSEVGTNLLPYFKLLQEKNESYLPQTIVQICSFEAVRQFHPEVKLEELIDAHKRFILHYDGDLSQEQKKNLGRLSLFLIPFSLHNHHMTLFSTLDETNNDIKHDSAVYIWRRGFSTRMNPIIFRKYPGNAATTTLGQNHVDHVQNDLRTLFHLFIKYLSRGLLFNELNKITNDDLCATMLKQKLMKATGVDYKAIKNSLKKIHDEEARAQLTRHFEESAYVKSLNTYDRGLMTKLKPLFIEFLRCQSDQDVCVVKPK
jgi:hypothetical protein